MFVKATDRLTDPRVARLRKATFDGKPLSDLKGWLRRTDIVQALIDDIWLLCHCTVTFDRT